MFNISNPRNQLTTVTTTNTVTGVRSLKQDGKQYSVKAVLAKLLARLTINLLREGLLNKSAKHSLEKNDDRIYLSCDRHSKDWREHKEAA